MKVWEVIKQLARADWNAEVLVGTYKEGLSVDEYIDSEPATVIIANRNTKNTKLNQVHICSG